MCACSKPRTSNHEYILTQCGSVSLEFDKIFNCVLVTCKKKTRDRVIAVTVEFKSKDVSIGFEPKGVTIGEKSQIIW